MKNKKRIVNIQILVLFEINISPLFVIENTIQKGKWSMGFLMLLISFVLYLIDYACQIWKVFKFALTNLLKALFK